LNRPREATHRENSVTTEHRDSDNVAVDPDESPFETPSVEGIPYELGSEEDRAIRRVLEESEAERRS
jgi:hypothetical protein